MNNKVLDNKNLDKYLKQTQINGIINAQFWESKKCLEIKTLNTCYNMLEDIINFLENQIEDKEKINKIENELEKKKINFKKLLAQSIKE